MIRLNPFRGIEPDAPMCSSGHRPFRDEKAALKALRSARRLRAKDSDAGRTPGRVERAAAECTACGWWHLHHDEPARPGRRSRDQDFKHGRRR